MGIGTFESLSNAAQGRMAPRVIAPPKSPVIPYKGTVSRISELATDKYAMGNPVLNKAISTPSTGGLSSSGKYSGFFSATDQQAAIEGSAINLRENVGPDLQAKAEAFYKKIDPMYGEASKGPSRYFMKLLTSGSTPGISQLPGVDPNRTNVTQGGYIDKIVNPSRQYANQLNDWYQTQSAPAQEYMGTAQRIAATPLSQLAAQTAVAGYGMNPDLATSKFANLDSEYLKRTRDAESINKYGVPYDEFKAKQDDLLYGTSEKKLALQDERVASAELDRVTGLGSKYLSATTGQTASQMYNVLGQEFKFNNPQTKTEENTNGAFFAQQYSQYLRDGKGSEAATLLNSIPSDKQDLKRLLLAIQSVFTSKAGKSAIATMTYDPLSGLDVNP